MPSDPGHALPRGQVHRFPGRARQRQDGGVTGGEPLDEAADGLVH
jgi:hypothetical protein